MFDPKADGRQDLSYREYQGLRSLFGSKNSLEINWTELTKRVKSIPNGYRDLRMLMSVTDKLLYKILETIPTERLKTIKKELDLTYCKVELASPMTKIDSAMVVVDEGPLYRLISEAVKYHCIGCDMTHKDAKRKCQFYKDIQSCYHYEFTKCDTCPFADTEI